MQPQEQNNYWQPSDLDGSQAQLSNESEVFDTSEEAQGEVEPITWQASEFVHHEKSGIWFLALLGVATVLLLVDIFLIRSWTFGALIVVMAVSAVVVARRPPRTLTYTLTPQGIRIDDKSFTFHDFKAFGVVQEGAFYSLRLVPNKRFMPMVSVFFPTELGEQIVDSIGLALPMEHIELDVIDKLVEKIRF
ncbi:MAG: hypothetical protein ABIR46_00270 [Candidatus Saccharimonadales bacterium]